MALDFKDLAGKAMGVLSKGNIDKDGDGIDLKDITGALKEIGGMDSFDLNNISGALKGFGALKNLSPSDNKVQSKVGELKDLISKNSGDANGILEKIAGAASSGDIKAQIDKLGGSGTGDFVKKAIGEFLKKK